MTYIDPPPAKEDSQPLLAEVDLETEEYGEESDRYTVVAFDPGGTTGWCVMSVHKEALTSPQYRIMDNVLFWSTGEFTGPEDEQVDLMVEMVEGWPEAHLVVEDFILRIFNSERSVLSPVRITAALAYAVRPRFLIYQTPALAKTTITDDRLKTMGYWRPGSAHVRDATRHALTWLKRTKERNDRSARTKG